MGVTDGAFLFLASGQRPAGATSPMTEKTRPRQEYTVEKGFQNDDNVYIERHLVHDLCNRM